MGQRQRLADALHRVGALALALDVRRRARVPVLSVVTYHHIYEPTGDYRFDDAVADASPAQFRRHLELLRRHCSPVTVADVTAALDGAPLPPNPVLVTFDDGYTSSLLTAAPILREFDMSAVFFIATDFVEDRRLYWWEAIAYLCKRSQRRVLDLAYPEPARIDLDAPTAMWRVNQIVKNHALDITRFVAELAVACGLPWTAALERELCDQLIMTWDDVRALAAMGMEIGSHCRSHRVLQTVPQDELHDELAGSRAALERELGQPVRAIAYPVGRPIVGERHLLEAVAAAGYDIGFTNASGVNALRTIPGMAPLHRFDVRRLATEREMSDAMYLAQIAVPPLAYATPSPNAH